VPALVRSLVDVPGVEVVTVVEEITRVPNAEQLAAIDAPGLVFVSAGAGTGVDPGSGVPSTLTSRFKFAAWGAAVA